jgi:hypothetical protein
MYYAKDFEKVDIVEKMIPGGDGQDLLVYIITKKDSKDTSSKPVYINAHGGAGLI